MKNLGGIGRTKKTGFSSRRLIGDAGGFFKTAIRYVTRIGKEGMRIEAERNDGHHLPNDLEENARSSFFIFFERTLIASR